MTENDIIGVGEPLPRIAAASPLDGRRAQISWRSGETQIVDLMPALASHRAFKSLRTDDALFKTMRIDEYGDAIEWADGAELSAMWIAELAPATLDNVEFRQAMDELNFSLDGMAARLGISRRLVASYRKDKLIPPAIALATRYLVELQKKAGYVWRDL